MRVDELRGYSRDLVSNCILYCSICRSVTQHQEPKTRARGLLTSPPSLEPVNTASFAPGEKRGFRNDEIVPVSFCALPLPSLGSVAVSPPRPFRLRHHHHQPEYTNHRSVHVVCFNQHGIEDDVSQDSVQLLSNHTRGQGSTSSPSVTSQYCQLRAWRFDKEPGSTPGLPSSNQPTLNVKAVAQIAT